MNEDFNELDLSADILPILKSALEKEVSNWFKEYDSSITELERLNKRKIRDSLDYADDGYYALGSIPIEFMSGTEIPLQLQNFINSILEESKEFAYTEFMYEYWNDDLDKEFGHPENSEELENILDTLSYNNKYNIDTDNYYMLSDSYFEDLRVNIEVDIALFDTYNPENKYGNENECFISISLNWGTSNNRFKRQEIEDNGKFSFNDVREFKQKINKAIQVVIKNIKEY